MKTKTPFYELAEKIGNDMDNNYWYLCSELKGEYNSFIRLYFQPDSIECDEYKHHPHTWATEREYLKYHVYSNRKGNQFRILALLFADLLWQEEMKIKKNLYDRLER